MPPPLKKQILFLLLSHRLSFTKKPLTRVSERVIGAHRKRSLERGWQKRVGGKGLAKGWRRVPRTLQLCNSRTARLEERVCDSMDFDHLAPLATTSLAIPTPWQSAHFGAELTIEKKVAEE